MNRQSNTYTLIYSIILVAVVGVALSVIYQALRPKQVENINNDTRKQILAAALITPREGQDIAQLYNEHIESAFLVDKDGNKISGEPKIDGLQAQVQKGEFPVFECKTDKGLKYILPVYGAGLWGPIWGYIAFDANGDTIYGAYFAHQGETPGLGAEIEKNEFRDQFEGKNIFTADGTFQSVQVVKRGQEPKDGSAYVHAISGGTITSQGVQKMLYTSLEPYTAFLTGLKNAEK
ncbi:MAG: NADH:ubiquinone reductase (Na(+)-transporting) subunit C [Bacteroidales bacterium]|nr:NADH:ubiquinone reductase (Na(+)-transporting) subunit C [Bacteroidales bacterium]